MASRGSDRAGHAGVFAHPEVAAVYRHRPPYPDEVFDLLRGLVVDRPATVLDIGAGEGALARPLAAVVDHVDAVDVSAAMIEAGRSRPAAHRTCGGSSARSRPATSPGRTRSSQREPACTGWTGDHDGEALGGHDRTGKPGSGRARPRSVPWEDRLVEVIHRHSPQPRLRPRLLVLDALAGHGSRCSARPRPDRRHSASRWMPTSSSSTRPRAWHGS